MWLIFIISIIQLEQNLKRFTNVWFYNFVWWNWLNHFQFLSFFQRSIRKFVNFQDWCLHNRYSSLVEVWRFRITGWFTWWRVFATECNSFRSMMWACILRTAAVPFPRSPHPLRLSLSAGSCVSWFVPTYTQDLSRSQLTAC